MLLLNSVVAYCVVGKEHILPQVVASSLSDPIGNVYTGEYVNLHEVRLVRILVILLSL